MKHPYIAGVDQGPFPLIRFAYVRKLTRTLADQLVRVFRIVSVMLNGFNHIAITPVREQSHCLGRCGSSSPVGAGWRGACCFAVEVYKPSTTLRTCL